MHGGETSATVMAGLDPAIQQRIENAAYSLLHGWPELALGLDPRVKARP